MTDTPKKKATTKAAENRRSLSMPRSFLTGSPMPEPRTVRRDDEAL